MNSQEREAMKRELLQEINASNQGKALVAASSHAGNTNNFPKLDGSNYQSWKDMVEIALKLRGLNKAVTEDQVDEVTDLQARLVLYETMDESHRSQVRGCVTTKAIVSRLDLIYADKSASNLHRMLTGYYRYIKDPKDSMSEHLGKMDQMRNSLRDLGIKVEDDRIHQATILGSLPREYSDLSEIWEITHTDMRTNANLVSRLLKRESDLKNTGQEYGLVARGKIYQRSPLTPEEKKKRYENMKCYGCGKLGHPARECPEASKDRVTTNQSTDTQRANVAQAVETPNGASPPADKSTTNPWAAVVSLPFNLKVTGPNQELRDDWVSDSGASSHMCNRKEWFNTLTVFEKPMQCITGNGSTMDITGIGSVNVRSKVGGKVTRGTLNKVFLAPALATNLFSVGAASEMGIRSIFVGDQCQMYAQNMIVAEGRRLKDGLYMMNMQADQGVPHVFKVQPKLTFLDWHKALGHASLDRVKTLLKDVGWSIPEVQDFDCPDCPEGKGRRVPHPSTIPKAEKPGRIHLDLSGHTLKIITSLQGYNYYLLCKDEHTDYVQAYFCKDKSGVPMEVARMIRDFERLSGHPVYEVVSDNGSEFNNSTIELLLIKNQISHIKSAPYCPQQNGRIEREMGTIRSSARTMLLASRLPIELWPEAIEIAAYVKNRLPNSRSSKTPYERLLNRKPLIEHMTEFGKTVHMIINDKYLTKWDARTKPGYVVGYTDKTNTYKVYIPDVKKVVTTCDIIFARHRNDEDTEQNTKQHKPEEVVELRTDEAWPGTEERGARDAGLDRTDCFDSEDMRSSTPMQLPNPEGDLVTGSKLDQFFSQYISARDQSRESDESSDKVVVSQRCDTPMPRKEQSPPPELTDQTCIAEDRNSAVLTDDSTMVGSGCPPRLSDHGIGIDRSLTGPPEPLPRTRMNMVSVNLEAPETFDQAVAGPNGTLWREAISEELKAHAENGTWEIVERPNKGTTLTARWVFVIKRDADGEIERFKARLVARGFLQKEGIDFYDSFAPVARIESIRTLLAVATMKQMVIAQFDVAAAFLHGEIEEEIFMEPPQGIKIQNNQCLRLIKALYGLKQAPRAWNRKLNQTLIRLGLTPTLSDPCVYVNKNASIYLIIYVDDGLVMAASKRACEDTIKQLEKEFKIRRMKGDLFVGIELTWQKGQLALSQRRYIRDVVLRFNLEDAKPASNPTIDIKHLIAPCDQSPTKAPYRQAIGCLLYVANCTRPDILFIVNLLARFNNDPREGHWRAVKQVIRYLKGTDHMFLSFTAGPSTVQAFSDADWASALTDRYSTSGVIIIMGGGPIVFSSRKQSALALSSTEAEYIAACDAAKWLSWLTGFLREVGFQCPVPTLAVDNLSTIKQIKNGDTKRRSKHVEIAHHFVRVKFQEGMFELEHVPSNNQLADLLTKPLSGPKLKDITLNLGVLRNK